MQIRTYNLPEDRVNVTINVTLKYEILAISAILAISILLFRCFHWDSFLYIYYNSDSLYVVNLYDAIKSGTLGTLQFSHLPSIFPDGLVISVLMAVGLPFKSAFMLYSGFALSSLMGIIVAIISELGEAGFKARCYGAFSIPIILALMPAGSFFLAQSLIPGVHGGSLILSFAAAWLSWKYLQSRGKRWGVLLSLAGLSGLGTFSDAILVFFFALPNLAGSAILALARRRVTKDLVLLNVAVLGMALAGYSAFTWLPTTPFPPNDPDAFANDARLFLSTFGSARSVIALLPAVILLLAGGVALFRRSGQIEARLYFTVTAMAAALAGIALVIAAYQDEYTYRYGTAAFWWPLCLGVALMPGQQILKPAFLLLFTFLAVTAWGKERDAFWAETLVACLDEMEKTVPLANGLADYWIAHPVTEFSGRRYVVNQVDSRGDPAIWINNRQDYFEGGNHPSLRVYNFTISNSQSRPELEQAYGPPDLRKACGGYSINYYANASSLQSRVAAWFQTRPVFSASDR